MSRHTSMAFRWGHFGLGVSLLLVASGNPAFAIPVEIDSSKEIPAQLLSFGPVQGNAFLPLTNAAGTSTAAGAPPATLDGYGWANSNISITLSSQRAPDPGPASTGGAFLGLPFDVFPTGGAVPSVAVQRCIERGRSGTVNDGDVVCVDSFFDVYFDVTITDVDAAASFLAPLPSTLGLKDLGSTSMQFKGECTADTSKPNLGCLPPVGNAYIGHFVVAANLGVDLNGNAKSDVIKFDFVQHQVGEVTNSFIQGGKAVDTFNSTIPGSGLVGDATADPPFTFTLTGPTTAQQGIVYPGSAPEPATLALLGLGLAGLGFGRRRNPVQA